VASHPGRRGGKWVQADRGARPSAICILTVEEAAYLAAEPADDGPFRPVSHTHWSTPVGIRPRKQRGVARTLLPDILFYDPTRPASYPDNGRKLSDDVMDGFVSILSNGR